MEQKLQLTKEALEKHGIKTRIVSTSAEARQIILDEVQSGQTVGIGGSGTIESINVAEGLEEKGCRLEWHWRAKSPDEAKAIRKNQLTSDVFLSSSNAVTQDGRLVNSDGIGNRVGAMIFGPPKVFVVCGQNKIVPDLDAAIERIYTVAAPKNAARVSGGALKDVGGSGPSEDAIKEMCRITVIIDRCPGMTDLQVILVREDLGY